MSDLPFVTGQGLTPTLKSRMPAELPVDKDEESREAVNKAIE